MGGHNPFSAWLKKSGVFSKNGGLLFLPGPVTAGLGSQLLFGASSALFPRQLWHPPVRPTTICSPSTSVNISQNMSGWWLSLPLWKIYKSVGIIIPNIYIWENNPNVPNHQRVYNWEGFLFEDQTQPTSNGRNTTIFQSPPVSSSTGVRTSTWSTAGRPNSKSVHPWQATSRGGSTNLYPSMRFIFIPDFGKAKALRAEGRMVGIKVSCPAPTGTSLSSPVWQEKYGE